MQKLPLRFALILGIALGITYLVHHFVLKVLGLPPFNGMPILSYTINFLLATLIFSGLYIARKKLKNALGFLFMGGSLLKFLVFFLVFYPTYRADGEIEGIEFAAFFIPYTIALVLETFFASKMLNNATLP